MITEKTQQLTHSTVAIGERGFEELENILQSRIKEGRKVFVLVDENTQQHCYPILLSHVPTVSKAEILEIESGEQSKCIEIATQLWKALTELEATRRGLFVNLGGGVIMDLGGFTASVFKRGMDFVHIPTTLLGMADACIGGKTGIDIDNLKNQVGTFRQPLLISIQPEFLKTLPKRQINAGFAEILKHALIADPDYFAHLITLSPNKEADWPELIARSIKIKSSFTNHDPFEENIRKALNFGHTFGHAFESWSMETQKNPMLHGEAVAAGMICEAYISHKAFGLKKPVFEQIQALILKWIKLKPMPEKSFRQIIDYMLQDKKNETDSINFTFIAKPGEFLINQSVASNMLREAFDYYNECTSR